MKKIKTGDTVMVIAGKFKGKSSTVESVSGDKVVVKGINVMKKAVKGQGFVDKIHPIHISNVMLYDEKAKKPSRVGITTDKSGKKTRTLKASGETIK